jgi:hypothetical protein
VFFPFREDRDAKKWRSSKEITEQLYLPFNGNEFVFEGAESDRLDTFYSTPSTRRSKSPHADPPATVRYKNVLFEVIVHRELYDPDRRVIIQFSNQRRPFPWPNPDDTDAKRMLERKGW